MRPVASLLIKIFTSGRNLHEPGERYRVAMIQSWFSIAGNLFISLLKLVFGLLANSIAMLADAVHSVTDISSSLVVMIGFKMAARRPDHEHPYGHGRAEYLAGLAIAVLLITTGVGFAWGSYSRLVSNVIIRPNFITFIVIVTTILFKEIMYYLSADLGKLIKSEALTGDAWHHRSDTLSSILVLIALVGGVFEIYTLDAYLGFAIAAFIIFAGVKIARNSCSCLLGTAPQKELHNEIISCTSLVEGVIGAHDLQIHDYGSWKEVTLHIEVSNNLNLGQAHQIAHQVEDLISKNFFCNTVVHLDPN